MNDLERDLHELAWAAGFFDGEGYVACKRHGGDPKNLIMHLGQVHREPLDRFLNTVGGGYIYGPYQPKQPNHKPFFVWETMNSREVRRISQLLAPFSCSIKRQQAESAITEYDLRVLKYKRRSA